MLRKKFSVLFFPWQSNSYFHRCIFIPSLYLVCNYSSSTQHLKHNFVGVELMFRFYWYYKCLKIFFFKCLSLERIVLSKILVIEPPSKSSVTLLWLRCHFERILKSTWRVGPFILTDERLLSCWCLINLVCFLTSSVSSLMWMLKLWFVLPDTG